MEARVKSNDPSEWNVVWNPDLNFSGNASYPTDGRETIWDPYERYVPTTTVGDFLEALDALYGEPTTRYFSELPPDLGAYLGQRVQSWDQFYDLEPDAKIDRFGRVEWKRKSAAVS